MLFTMAFSEMKIFASCTGPAAPASLAGGHPMYNLRHSLREYRAWVNSALLKAVSKHSVPVGSAH
jgi:hypothetical protein